MVFHHDVEDVIYVTTASTRIVLCRRGGRQQAGGKNQDSAEYGIRRQTKLRCVVYVHHPFPVPLRRKGKASRFGQKIIRRVLTLH